MRRQPEFLIPNGDLGVSLLFFLLEADGATSREETWRKREGNMKEGIYVLEGKKNIIGFN